MNNLKRFLFAFLLIGSFVKAQTVFIGSNINEKINPGNEEPIFMLAV